MFKKISDKIKYPNWVSYCERYRRLDLYDRLLDGTFYDHLQWAFYDEVQEPQMTPILLENRRPSAQYRVCTEIASYTARKLFAGNHAPRVAHENDAAKADILRIMNKAQFMPKMLEAAVRGSVGSVGLTFRVDNVVDAQGKPDIQIMINIWPAKDCDPSFDDQENLTTLRVRYLVQGSELIALKSPPPRDGETIKPREKYWFVRDYIVGSEITYRPIAERDWNPVDGFVHEPERQFIIWDPIVPTGMPFVTGWWFRNLSGGRSPDGECTFRPAIPNSIDIDYTMSSIGRGVRYNAAPTVVVIGEVLGASGDNSGSRLPETASRNPAWYMHLEGGGKDEDGGVMRSPGDAKLLEMAGTGLEASLKYVKQLADHALEAIAANRKDPEKMKGPMSGRAMEFIDQEFYDLIMELRGRWGEHGALQLLRRIVQTCDPTLDLSSLNLLWPRLFQPTPDDLAQVIPALAIAIDPLKAGPAMPAEPGGTGADGTSKPGKPATTGPDPEFMLLTPKQARAWLAMNMDLNLLASEDESPEQPSAVRPGGAPEITPPPAEVTEPATDIMRGIPNPTNMTLDM